MTRDFCGLSVDALQAQALALLPEGPAWPREPSAVMVSFWRAMATPRQKTLQRFCTLLNESVLCDAVELLGDYETDYGLPDSCDPSASSRNIAERQTALCDKANGKGGQSIAYFEGVAARLGYDVEIEEMRGAIAGLSECGGADVCGDETLRFWWTMRIIGPRVTWAECGLAEAGDYLAEIAIADDLECRIDKLMPAHTELIFSYEG